MIVSKSFSAAPWLRLLCFRLLWALFLIGYCFVSRDNLQIKRTFVLGVPHTAGFLIVNIQLVVYLWFAIGATLTFFWADSVTLNTPHTTGKSDTIIFRTTKIIRALTRIVGRGEIGPKSARLSCGVYPALGVRWSTYDPLKYCFGRQLTRICIRAIMFQEVYRYKNIHITHTSCQLMMWISQQLHS